MGKIILMEQQLKGVDAPDKKETQHFLEGFRLKMCIGRFIERAGEKRPHTRVNSEIHRAFHGIVCTIWQGFEDKRHLLILCKSLATPALNPQYCRIVERCERKHSNTL